MSSNPFSLLPEDTVRTIIKDSGNLANLARVSKRMEKEANEVALVIFDAMIAGNDPDVFRLVLESVGINKEASLAIILDRIFKKARRLDTSLKANLEPSNPYDLSVATKYLDIFYQSQALNLLYSAILREASPQLKTIMDKIVIDKDPIKSLEQIKAFFKDNASELATITILNANNLGLSLVPNEIVLLTNLEVLDLSGNKLFDFPEELFQLEFLHTLSLNHNLLGEIPSEIQNLTKLKFLSLNNNRLKKLPSNIGNLMNLQSLQVNNNHLAALPQSIGKLNSLVLLSATGNRLKKLPDSLGNLNALECLYLSNNRINQLPLCIGKLKSLVVFSIVNNQLSVLPDEITQMTSLKYLLVSQNELHCLPKDLGNMPNLQELYASGNQFRNSYQFSNLIFCTADASLESERGFTEHAFQVSEIAFQLTYDRLAENKWKEFVDGSVHSYGREVFDKGLHGGAVEPGFALSMENAFEFLKSNFFRELDASFYLGLHKVACAHFQGKKTSTIVGQEKIGKFRGKSHYLSANFSQMAQDGIDEFNRLNHWVSYFFGPSFALGKIVPTSNPSLPHQIQYYPMSEEEVKTLFTYFVSLFHFERDHATKREQVFEAIGKLIPRLEWLHPVPDGCGRTDTAMLNFLLTKYGYNPVLLEYPYLSSCRSHLEWMKYLAQGMDAWKSEATTQSISNDNVEMLDVDDRF